MRTGQDVLQSLPDISDLELRYQSVYIVQIATCIQTLDRLMRHKPDLDQDMTQVREVSVHITEHVGPGHARHPCSPGVRGQVASRRSAFNTTSRSVVAHIGGSDARRNSP